MDPKSTCIIITGRSAVELYRHLSEDDCDLDWSERPRVADSQSVMERATSPTLREGIRVTRMSPILESLSKPITCLQQSQADRRRNALFQGRSWAKSLPPGSLIEIAENVYVCSPEFRFLQAARVLPIPRCAVFGTELAGSYIRSGSSPYGCLERPPQTTLKQLAEYVHHADGLPGVDKARRAARHVLEHARSPRESIVGTLLVLPRHGYGGFGLPRPELNAKVETNLDYEVTGISRLRVCDLLFKEIGLDVEYNGHQHEEQQAVLDDMQRMRDLLQVGINVVSLTDAELRSIAEMTSLAHSIERMYGLRRRRETPRQLDLRRQLFAELFKTNADGPAAPGDAAA